MARRVLPGILLLAAILHTVGIARTLLPAQDGLKFLRSRPRLPEPALDRGHPRVRPAPALSGRDCGDGAAGGDGSGTRSRNLAHHGEGISALASLGLIVPLFFLTEALFGGPAAALAALLFVILPVPAEIGRDTLSDPLALFFFTLGLFWAERALRTHRLLPALGCGLAAGLGYWTRPEAVVLPVVVVAVAGVRVGWKLYRDARAKKQILALFHEESAVAARLRPLSVLALSFLAVMGVYALTKGEVSEKLALRRSAEIASKHDQARSVSHPLPKGLDDPRWDFAPKEESSRDGPHSLIGAIRWTLRVWAEALGGVFAVLALWGAWKVRAEGPGRILVAAYVAVFGAILIRHAATFHYLSGRHGLTLAVATLPWAAAGALALKESMRRRWSAFLCVAAAVPAAPGSQDRNGRDGRRYTEKTVLVHPLGEAWKRRMGTPSAWRWGIVLGGLVVIGAAMQLRPEHLSRAGHRDAGRWLAAHTQPGEAILDTRGWAAFVSGLHAYDPWHIPQALSDARLSYIVIGADELGAKSRRAETWRALLAYAAEPVISFPARSASPRSQVCIYRFHPPASWEGLRP